MDLSTQEIQVNIRPANATESGEGGAERDVAWLGKSVWGLGFVVEIWGLGRVVRGLGSGIWGEAQMAELA